LEKNRFTGSSVGTPDGGVPTRVHLEKLKSSDAQVLPQELPSNLRLQMELEESCWGYKIHGQSTIA